MSSAEETALALSHSNRHQILFQTHPNSSFSSTFPCSNNNTTGKPTPELTSSFIHHRFHHPQGSSEVRQSMYNSGSIHHRGVQNWCSGNARGSDSASGDGSDGDDEDDEDGVEGIVNVSDNKNDNSGEKDGNVKLNHLSSFGSSREVVKVGSLVPSRSDLNDVKPSTSENHQQEPIQYPNAVALVDRDGELYYSQYLHGSEGLGSGLKDRVGENDCGFSGRKDAAESGDSLRTILSDPLTGALMDDAMILPCGHSFGSGGLQHVMKIKVCYTCSRPVTEDSVAPNLSLRSAVLAFRREEESQAHHASKRKRERLDQERINNIDFSDTRGKGLQLPFSVADRVIIKGNKRIPERFVGCEAVVTTQCLNGWYVVKTLDTAESIKVQYRSLAKVSDNSSSHPTSSKTSPNWL